MTNTPERPQPWVCKGTRSSPHEEIENWGDKCSYPGCSNVRNGNGPSGPPVNRKKILIGGGAVIVFALGAVLLIKSVTGDNPASNQASNQASNPPSNLPSNLPSNPPSNPPSNQPRNRFVSMVAK